jgi:GMP synthase PP-ATPase subunit
MMKAVEEMKKIFIKVLYSEMKYMKRSMYLMQKTIKYIS